MEPAMGILSIPAEYFKKVEIFYYFFTFFYQGYSLLFQKSKLLLTAKIGFNSYTV